MLILPFHPRVSLLSESILLQLSDYLLKLGRLGRQLEGGRGISFWRQREVRFLRQPSLQLLWLLSLVELRVAVVIES